MNVRFRRPQQSSSLQSGRLLLLFLGTMANLFLAAAVRRTTTTVVVAFLPQHRSASIRCSRRNKYSEGGLSWIHRQGRHLPSSDPPSRRSRESSFAKIVWDPVVSTIAALPSSSSFGCSRRQQRRYAATTTNGGAIATADAERFVEETVAHVLEALRDEFQRASTPEPLQSTVHLLALVLQLPWATGFRDLLTLMLMQEEPSTPEDCRRENSTLGARRLTVAEAQQLDNLVRRRIRHEPLQYLAGQWDFLDSTFLVRAPLLCPRPETEELVLLVLDDLHPRTNDETKPTTGTNLRILDVGCGTGCIGLALADKLRTCTVQAVDVEPIAVEIAAANAVRMGCAHRYSVQQVAAADYSVTGDDEERFDVVVSNPPYIPDGDMLALEPTVVNYESASALQGGSDGMDVIRTIVQRLPLWCKPGAVCWMEVDPTHPALLRAWLTTEEGSRTVPNNSVVFVSSHRDLSGRDRFVKLRVV